MLVLPVIWGVCFLGYCCDGRIYFKLAILKYYSWALHWITPENNTRKMGMEIWVYGILGIAGKNWVVLDIVV
jgi:hypothetical protein